MAESTTKNETEKNDGENVLNKVFGMFFKATNINSSVKKEIKQLSRTLKKSRFKFYNVRTNELDVSLARFFYLLYRFFGPLQSMLSRYGASDVLKIYMVERSLTPEAAELRRSFTEEAVNDMAETKETKQLAKDLQESFNLFKKYLAKSGSKQINEDYSAFMAFLQMVNFDFFYALKKFDPKIPELDFIYKTRFEPIIGLKLIEELKDFCSLIESIDTQAAWEDIFNAFNEYRGAEIISVSAWKKTIKMIEDVKKSRVIEMIVMVIESDPGFVSKPYKATENIVASYVANVGKELQDNVKKIIDQKKDDSISEFVKRVFGKAPANRVKNYSEKMNEAVKSRCTVDFVYANAINYLKSFYLDFLKKDIREVVNQYLISGKWYTTIASQQLSDSFHRLLELSDELQEFDKELGEEFRRGQSIRTYTRNEKDKSNSAILERLVREINEDAKKVVVESAQNFVKIAKMLRSILEDYNSQPKKIISNWKEIEGSYKGELLQDTQAVYKKIYEMVQLLQFFLSK